MLVRLLYASRINAGVDDRVLHDILHQASAANPVLGITGALCCSQGICSKAAARRSTGSTAASWPTRGTAR